MLNTFKVLFTALAILGSSTIHADLAIIAHPDYEGGDLTEEAVRKLFLSERVSFPSGHKAEILNHAVGSQDRKHFFEYILKMGEQQNTGVIGHEKISTGKRGSPKELNTYDDVLNWVATTPLGISYVDKRMVSKSVKVLLTVDVFEDI